MRRQIHMPYPDYNIEVDYCRQVFNMCVCVCVVRDMVNLLSATNQSIPSQDDRGKVHLINLFFFVRVCVLRVFLVVIIVPKW